MDKQIIKDQIEGLIESGKELRKKEALFIKAQGIDIVIEKNKAEKESLMIKLEKTKEALKTLKAKKQKAVDTVSEKICSKLNEFLPIGESFFDAIDGVSIGWIYDGTRQPYNSLSGAQKQIFDTALENMLGSNILIVEAAEIDKNHLTALIEDISGNEKQVFISTWFNDLPEFDGVEVVNIQ